MEANGKIINGAVVLDNGNSLPEGSCVRVIVELQPPLGKRLLRFAGLAKGLPEDFAENHDHYLHGTPKKS
ncbi:MAG: hypothetical protein AAB353_07270 [Candidatus Hydrogenedentota bacterium]